MLHREQKARTNDGMLPQSRPLETCVADKPKVPARNGYEQMAAMQLSRKDTSSCARLEVSSALAEDSVSRVFALSRKRNVLNALFPAKARKSLKTERKLKKMKLKK